LFLPLKETPKTYYDHEAKQRLRVNKVQLNSQCKS